MKVEYEILGLLLQDKDGEFYNKAQLQFKNTNPFERGQALLYDCIVKSWEDDVQPTIATMQDAIEKSPDRLRVAGELVIRDLKIYEPKLSNFDYALKEFWKEAKDRDYLVALRDAQTIVSDGLKVGREKLEGKAASQHYLLRRISELEQEDTGLLKGDIREEGEAVWQEYQEKVKHPEKTVGVLTGFDEVDLITRGSRGGELWIVAAFASQGKSTCLYNMAHTAVAEYGRNIILASGETPRNQIRNRIYTRHSCHPRWIGKHDPLHYDSIRDGRLSKDEAEFFKEVVDDFGSNPSYGHLDVLQFTMDMSILDLEQYCRIVNQQYPIDVLFIDYLTLLKPIRALRNPILEAGETMRAAKQVAIRFGVGSQMSIIAAHQQTRDAFEKAEKSEEYNLRSMSFTSEAERSTDVVMWLLRLDKHKARHELTFGIIKNRDGRLLKPSFLYEDFDSVLLGNIKSAPATSEEVVL